MVEFVVAEFPVDKFWVVLKRTMVVFLAVEVVLIECPVERFAP